MPDQPKGYGLSCGMGQIFIYSLVWAWESCLMDLMDKLNILVKLSFSYWLNFYE